MFTVCWAAKGGSGTTSFVATWALAHSLATDQRRGHRATGPGALVVDLAGDIPLVLGLDDTDRPGAHDWLASTAAAERLDALEIQVKPGLAVIPSGTRSMPVADPERWRALGRHLAADRRHVIVDAGTLAPPSAFADCCDRRWLVTRSCYLAIRAAIRAGRGFDGVVLVAEPGRGLSASDIESALGVPVTVIVDIDPAVARAIDAGLLVSRLPSSVRRQLARVA